jgi:hypothetical protein
MGKAKDYTGQRQGHLQIKSFARVIGKSRCWNCVCDCGRSVLVSTSSLNGGQMSCNCEQKANRCTHGLSKSAEYNIWRSMRDRCDSNKNKGWNRYGGRGIKVCKEWEDFPTFYADMGPRPSPNHSIERQENNKGYFKENCRWATALEQGRNKRNNRLLEMGGVTKSLGEWVLEYKQDYRNVHNRLKRGWSVTEALTILPFATGQTRVPRIPKNKKAISA